jgi:WD40 repeat protein
VHLGVLWVDDSENAPSAAGNSDTGGPSSALDDEQSSPGGSAATDDKPKPKDSLDKLESVSRVLAAIAIPTVIALGGWAIQNSVSHQSISKDYVTLAISILEKSDVERDSGLREWAVDLLNDNSPTRFSPAIAADLKSGALNLQQAIGAAVSSSANGGVAVAPARRQIAAITQRGVVVYNLGERLPPRLLPSLGHVNSVIYSADGQWLISGNSSGSIDYWRTQNWSLDFSLHVKDSVTGLAVTRDGRELVAQVGGEKLAVFDIQTRRQINEITAEATPK